MRSKTAFLIPIIILVFGTSCEDLISVDHPKTQLIKATVFEDDRTALSAVSGLYAGLTSLAGGFTSVTYMAALSADELTLESGDAPFQFFRNELFSTNPTVSTIWSGSYTQIAYANAAIEGLENSTAVTASLRGQLLGEAKLLRAFHHFYLVNLYGNVPYVTTTDYRVNGLVARMPVATVYEKIVTDLLDAKLLLADDYSYSQNDRVRVNKWAATALLARVYLYLEDWVHAEEQASTVIAKSTLYNSNIDLASVFVKNSTEIIWQLIPPHPLQYTLDGGVFIRTVYSDTQPILSDGLYNSFEDDDLRKTLWVGTASNINRTWRYPFKYKESGNNATGKEYSAVLRLAEQHLIRAEARAKQGRITGTNSAETDVNVIRIRAGLTPTTADDADEMLVAIEHERRVELFTEWGHRWFDLKRRGRANDVLLVIKSEWNDTDVLYPVPFAELQLNPNLKPQNDGY